jgi:tetratricopeptide (TPR) repeat protein
VFARYPYQSTALPVAGKRAAAEPLFNEAVAAHREGKLGKAMDNYRAALRQDPRFFDAQLNLGIAAAQATDLSLALASLEDAVRLEPRSAEARYQFAMALRRANYPLDAALELKTLTEDWPGEARAYLALGNLYSQVLNKPAEAATNYQKVLELAPQHPQGPQIRAWLARQQ